MKKPVIAILLAAIVLFGASFALNNVGQKNALAEHKWLLQTLLPDSTNFTQEDYTGEDANIRSIHKADNGFVVETVTYGYADEMTILVGVSNEGTVTGLVVLDAHETLGLGSRALTDHEFLAQFLNGSSFTVGTSGADAFSSATGTTESTGEEIEVDALSGATVTSKAVARCVNSAVAYVTGADTTTAATSWGG